MDLSTTYLGLKLRTPLVVAASPLSEEIESIEQLEEAGASAVVLYSLFEEQLRQDSAELAQSLEHGTFSTPEALTYFPEPEEFRLGPEEYLKHIARAKKAVDIPIIASLNGSSAGGWTAYAQAIQQAGADALELNIYHIPTDMDQTSLQVEQNYLEILKAVRSAVHIPVAILADFQHMRHRDDQRRDPRIRMRDDQVDEPGEPVWLPWRRTPCMTRLTSSACSSRVVTRTLVNSVPSSLMSANMPSTSSWKWRNALERR